MLTTYRLEIKELNKEPMDLENVNLFTMEDVMTNAKNGDFELLNLLYQASKIQIYKVNTTSYKGFKDRHIEKYNICTPASGRNVLRDNIGLILPTQEEVVEHLVKFHNTYCDQIKMEEVSLDEIKALHSHSESENE